MADSQTLQVNFSEPISTTVSGFAGALTVKLDGTTKYIPQSAISEITTDYKKVGYKTGYKIDLSKCNLDADKTYTVAIKGLTDFASNSIPDYSGSFTYAKDSTNPTVVSVSPLDVKTVKIKFSEKVKKSSINVTTTINSTTYNATIADFDSSDPDGKTFAATFTTAPTSDGTSSLVTVSNFADLAGNVQSTANVNAITWADTNPAVTSTAATVEKLSGSYYAVYTFDRDVTVGTGNVTGKYVDSDGVTHTTSDWTPGVGTFDHNTQTSLNSNQIAVLIDGYASGSYTATFNAGSVVDAYNNGNLKTTTTFSNTSATTTKQVVGAWVNNATAISGTDSDSTNITTAVPADVAATINADKDLNKVFVYFNGDVDNSALDVSNYTLDGVQAFSSAVLDGSKHLVKLTLKDGAVATTANKSLAIKGIDNVDNITIYKDAASAGSSNKHFDTSFTENVLPTVGSIKLIDLTHIQVVFNENIEEHLSPSADFIIRVNGVKVSTNFSINADTVVITIPAVSVADSSKITLEIPSTNNITDLNENGFDQLAATPVAVSYGDLVGTAKTKLDSAFALLNGSGDLVSGKTVTDLNNAITDVTSALNAAGLTQNTDPATVSYNGATTYAAALAYLNNASDIATAVASYTNAANGAAENVLLNASPNALGLTLTNYAGLDATGKTAVGTALYNTRATLTTKTLVQSAVTSAIAAADTSNINAAASTLALLQSSGANLGILPSTSNGVAITWVSANTSVVTSAGVYAGTGTTTLTATLAKGTGTPATVVYTVTADASAILTATR